MTATEFFTFLKRKFPFDLTSEQEEVLRMLASFCVDGKKGQVFLLKGYAGTGKTTLLSVLNSQLWHLKMKAVQLAPTGRAAKVIRLYSGKEASTIHRKIYNPKSEPGGGVKFVLARNTHRDTLFLVDEASMIPDQPSDQKMFENGSLLQDLIQFVDSGVRCKLILIGDTAQLPPVRSDLSPALDEHTLSLSFSKEVQPAELTDVVRQAAESGILVNATRIREQLQEEFFEQFQFELAGYPDIVRLVDGYEIQEAIDESYSEVGREETALIVRSNKRAIRYNQTIRQKILFLDQEVAIGDYLMVVRNNYFWLDPKSEAGFVANGDIVELLELFGIKELYGFRFAEAKVKLVDYPDQKPFETVLLLDTLNGEGPSLSYEDSNRLYQSVREDYADEKSNYKRFLAVKNNKYFNALQVKFAYALTCHKSQGGQWSRVFVEQPYLPDGVNRDYLRWLYTAVTRAREKLYLIGFPGSFFAE